MRLHVVITSKVWNSFHKYENVKKLAKFQLGLWGIECTHFPHKCPSTFLTHHPPDFDLFLVHFPIALKYVDPATRYPPEWWNNPEKTEVQLEKVPLSETWKAMEELVDEGLAKNIGISNTAGALLNDLLQYARIEPQVLQIEHHPYLTQEDLVHYVKDVLGLAITGYSSFGPQSFYELGGAQGVPSLLEHDLVADIAKAHDKTPAQILLRWATQRGIAVVPKSNNQGRLEQNLQTTDFHLTEEQIKAISGLNRNLRFNDPKDIDPRLAIFA